MKIIDVYYVFEFDRVLVLLVSFIIKVVLFVLLFTFSTSFCRTKIDITSSVLTYATWRSTDKIWPGAAVLSR